MAVLATCIKYSVCLNLRIALYSMCFLISRNAILGFRKNMPQCLKGLQGNLDMFFLNSIEPSIQFTVERETDGKLPFLDTYVQRTTHGKLETLVYRKPTHTDKYLSFNSHHPRSHKRSVVTTLFQRAENLTSNNDARENKCQYVTNILKENSYPTSFLYDCLRRPTLTHCNSPEGDSAVRGFAIVPYIQGIAEPIRSVLNNCGIKVALKLFQTLGHIFAKPKDRVPTDQKTHAV